MPRSLSVSCLLLAFVVAGPFADGAHAAEQAGVSAAVRGEVALTSVVTAETRRPASGEEVFLGDAVRTGSRSGLQILLLDQSVFTVGESAELTIDRYVYDPERGVAALSASLVRGGLRFVSGKISETQPDNVEIRMPTATIGVRGTIVTALQTDTGAYVFLDGPAIDNDAFQREGLAEVAAGGETVTLSRTGFATFVPTGGVPQPPFRPDAALRQALRGAVADSGSTAGTPEGRSDGAASGPRGGAVAAAVGNPADSAGATRVGALGTAVLSAGIGARQAAAERLDPELAVDEDETEPPQGFSREDQALAASIPDFAFGNFADIATIADLDSVGGGVGHFFGTGVFVQTVRDGDPLSSPAIGEMELSAEIDFANRTIFGGNSAIRVRAGSIDRFELLEVNGFDEGAGGLAVFGSDETDPDSSPIDGVLYIRNGAGVADTASGFVVYDDGSDVGAGAIVDLPRRDGPAPALGGGS